MAARFYQLKKNCPPFRVADGPNAGAVIERGGRYPDHVVEQLSPADRARLEREKAAPAPAVPDAGATPKKKGGK